MNVLELGLLQCGQQGRGCCAALLGRVWKALFPSCTWWLLLIEVSLGTKHPWEKLVPMPPSWEAEAGVGQCDWPPGCGGVQAAVCSVVSLKQAWVWSGVLLGVPGRVLPTRGGERAHRLQMMGGGTAGFQESAGPGVWAAVSTVSAGLVQGAPVALTQWQQRTRFRRDVRARLELALTGPYRTVSEVLILEGGETPDRHFQSFPICLFFHLFFTPPVAPIAFKSS